LKWSSPFDKFILYFIIKEDFGAECPILLDQELSSVECYFINDGSTRIRYNAKKTIVRQMWIKLYFPSN